MAKKKASGEATKAEQPGKGKKRQGELPGMEKKHIKEVEDAAAAYESARDRRMKLTDEEVEKQQALIDVMKKHKLSVYRDDEAVPPILVTLKAGKDRVKVERITQAEG